jgi:hypothetical protein
MPQLAAPIWPPPTINPPAPGEGPRWAHIPPRWQRPGFIPELELVDWPLAVEHREAHETALAAAENVAGPDPRQADQDKLRDALAELLRVSEAAVFALQAPDAAQPAHASYAEARARLTPPAPGPAQSGAVGVRHENDRAVSRNAEVSRFYSEHKREREALRRDFERLRHLLGPSFCVTVDAATAQLLGEPEPPELPGNRQPGEAAPPIADPEKSAA